MASKRAKDIKNNLARNHGTKTEKIHSVEEEKKCDRLESLQPLRKVYTSDDRKSKNTKPLPAEKLKDHLCKYS